MISIAKATYRWIKVNDKQLAHLRTGFRWGPELGLPEIAFKPTQGNKPVGQVEGGDRHRHK